MENIRQYVHTYISSDTAHYITNVIKIYVVYTNFHSTCNIYFTYQPLNQILLQ